MKCHWLIEKLINSSANGEAKFKITETKLYVPVVTLSTQDNAKLLQQLKYGFKRTIDGKNVFYQPINSMTKTYKDIRKIAISQGDDYTTGCLLDYSFFKDHYQMIAIDLSKQQALDVHLKAIQQINFMANLGRVGNTTMFFIIEEAKETVLEFSQGTVKVL